MDEHATRPGATEPSDERLFAIVQESNSGLDGETALRQLIHRYQGRLYAYAYRILHHSSDAEDAVQEAFVRAIRYANKFSPKKSRSSSPFRTWIYTITRSTAIDIARQRHPIDDFDAIGRSEDHLAFSPIEHESLVSHPTESLNAQLDAKLQLGPALAAMATSDQALLHLVYTEDLSLNEVAEIFGISLTAVKVRLHRARQRLKSILTGQLEHNEQSL